MPGPAAATRSSIATSSSIPLEALVLASGHPQRAGPTAIRRVAASPDIGHYGGAITNNFVVANDARLFASGAGFDTGIGLEQSCETTVVHNTVVSTHRPRSSSIEWRFANTTALVANNLVTHALLPRDGARASLAGNVGERAVVAVCRRGERESSPVTGRNRRDRQWRDARGAAALRTSTAKDGTRHPTSAPMNMPWLRVIASGDFTADWIAH